MRQFRGLWKNHPRLIGGAAVGVGVAAVASLPASLRVLVGWNTAIWIYLILTGIQILTARPGDTRRHAATDDENAATILVIVCVSAVASLGAIVFDLVGARDLSAQDRAPHFMIAALTVLGSWFLIGVTFAIHYASLFYSKETGGKSLRFPDRIEEPDYWDFLYFSFTINVAVQTSDVAIASPALRRVALAQSVICFLFNTAILGLGINIAAGLTTG